MTFSLAFPAPAFEIFGLHLWGTKQHRQEPAADIIGEPKYYQLEINAVPREENGQENAREIVKQASILVADAAMPVSGSAGLIAKTQEDYRRILAALYANGYYGGTISITLNGQEAADLAIDTSLPDESQITITVDTGEIYHFERAEIYPLAQPAMKRRNNKDAESAQGFAIGETARSDHILQAEQKAIEHWRAQGHAKARMMRRDIIADHQTHKIEADIEIDQGPVAHYGSISVHNRSPKMRMDTSYLGWMSGIKPGQIYDPQQLKRATKRLQRLEVFRSVTVNEAEQIEPDGSLPISLDVQERPPRRFGAGAAYSTLDGAGFESYWLHRNLFGHAEKLRFEAKINGIGANHDNSFHPENYSYQLGSSFTRPGIFTPDTDLIISLKAQREVLENYTATGLYLQSGLTHSFHDTLNGRLLFDVSHTHTKDDYFGTRNFTLVGLHGGVAFDRRDDQKNAKSGLYVQATLSPVYEAEYGNIIAQSTLEGRLYHTLDQKGRFVLAGRGKIGMMVGAQAEEIPPNMLFFSGGGGSVRGYGYRNIGVVTQTGEVIGGRSLLEAAGETRVEVTQDIGLVGFVDVGQVGEESYPDFSQSLKWGTGLGFRYQTSLGPLRLDVARPLNGKKGDPDLGLYIGIGQAF